MKNKPSESRQLDWADAAARDIIYTPRGRMSEEEALADCAAIIRRYAAQAEVMQYPPSRVNQNERDKLAVQNTELLAALHEIAHVRGKGGK